MGEVYSTAQAAKVNAAKLQRGQDFIVELVELVGAVKNILINMRVEGREVGFRHITRDGEAAFTPTQLRALASVGSSTAAIIELYETNKLYERLGASLVRNILAPKKKELSAPTQRAMSLVDMSHRSMERA